MQPIDCPTFCGTKNFRDKDSLGEHLKNECSKAPLECTICGDQSVKQTKKDKHDCIAYLKDELEVRAEREKALEAKIEE